MFCASKKRLSDQRWPDTEEMEGIHQMGRITLTGDRPTGRLHVGYYVGSLKRRVELQNPGELDEIYIITADAQALTDNMDNLEGVRQSIIEVALDYPVYGLDPKKPVLSIQSQVPELCEMTFYYVDSVTVSRLQHNPTVRPEIQVHNFEASIPAGLFIYLTSQAVDITVFKATTVPVGEDQAPMIEQAREIVHKFNSVYGETLVEPDVLLLDSRACLRLSGIDGKAKMNKSLGNCIYLSDPEDEIKKKIMSMFIGPDYLKVEDPGQVEGNSVLIRLDVFCWGEHFEKYPLDCRNLDGLKAHYTRGGLDGVKVERFPNSVLQDELRSIHKCRGEITKDVPTIYRTPGEGSHEAEQKAAQTLAEMKRAVKINYFGDKELIARQAERPRIEMEQILYDFIWPLWYTVS